MPKKKLILTHCCNPMNIQNHTSARKDIRRVTLELRKKFPSLPEGAKICETCRKKTSNFCKEELTSTSESDNPEIVSTVFILHSGLSRK